MKTEAEVKQLRDEALANLQKVEQELLRLGEVRGNLRGVVMAYNAQLEEAPMSTQPNRAQRRRIAKVGS